MKQETYHKIIILNIYEMFKITINAEYIKNFKWMMIILY